MNVVSCYRSAPVEMISAHFFFFAAEIHQLRQRRQRPSGGHGSEVRILWRIARTKWKGCASYCRSSTVLIRRLSGERNRPLRYDGGWLLLSGVLFNSYCLNTTSKADDMLIGRQPDIFFSASQAWTKQHVSTLQLQYRTPNKKQENWSSPDFLFDNGRVLH